MSTQQTCLFPRGQPILHVMSEDAQEASVAVTRCHPTTAAAGHRVSYMKMLRQKEVVQ